MLEEAPAALGWTRWKEIEDRYFLGKVSAAFALLSHAGLIDIPEGDLVPRMFLSALGSAGMSLVGEGHLEARRNEAAELVMRSLRGMS